MTIFSKLVRRIIGNKRGDSPTSDPIPPLYFKDNNAAFRYACEYLDTELRDRCFLPAIVKMITRRSNGRIEYRIRVASNNHGFEFDTWTESDSLHPVVGDLVAFWVAETQPRLLGLIVCRLDPVWDSQKGWKKKTV